MRLGWTNCTFGTDPVPCLGKIREVEVDEDINIVLVGYVLPVVK